MEFVSFDVKACFPTVDIRYRLRLEMQSYHPAQSDMWSTFFFAVNILLGNHRLSIAPWRQPDSSAIVDDNLAHARVTWDFCLCLSVKKVVWLACMDIHSVSFKSACKLVCCHLFGWLQYLQEIGMPGTLNFPCFSIAGTASGRVTRCEGVRKCICASMCWHTIRMSLMQCDCHD